ncbi:hypothetical protein QTO30_14855 [Yoonia sp. GPGPB17]|uniref:hypothetical protein n=1 Tax=Yoonia sp. GPGPB17 TaxID=3026147 RepID=UPI0030BDA7D8
MLTQIGGLAWIVALMFRRRLFAFLLTYTAMTLGTLWIAPSFGRTALSCAADGPLQVQHWMYCALNRNYVTPELAEALEATAIEMDERYPGTVTLVLDANFPFFDNFPLLPHLSHDDGEKADLAFYYQDGTGYLAGATRSPIGYFAFEPGPTNCTPTWPSLRWDFVALQPLWPNYTLAPERNRAVLQILADDPRIGRIFVEPHLLQSLDITHTKIRFQGCRAARHDDHIHLQLR